MWFRVGIVAIVASFAVWVVIALAPLVGPVVGLSLGEAGGARCCSGPAWPWLARTPGAR